MTRSGEAVLFLNFAGYCPAENILLGKEILKKVCWTLSGREYFAGHCPAENIFLILLDIVQERVFFFNFAGYCLAENILLDFVWEQVFY